MKAIGLYRYLPVEDEQSFVEVDIPAPIPGDRDVLVRVKAVSVNPVDTKMRAPKDKIEREPRVLGWDAAGVVEAVGSDCQLFKVGDEVYYAGSVARPGSDSELQVVDERIVGRKPTSLDFGEAAALPLTSLTAWEGLFVRLGAPRPVEAGQRVSVLIISASGGVGSIATQLAHEGGLTVIGTASRPETISWAKEHGADFVIDHHKSLSEQIKALGFENVDFILCLSSTEQHWDEMVACIAPEGKICSIVETEKPLNLTALQSKSATFVWEFMFTRSLYQTADMQQQHEILDELADLIDAGKIRTTLTQRLSPINAENLRKAHGLVEKGSMIGKVVVENFE